MTNQIKPFTRICPNCNKSIIHKSKRSMRNSQREKRLCRTCASKKRISEFGMSDAFIRFTKKGSNVGEANPFFGKTHTEETKIKIKNRDKSFFNSQKYKDKVSKNNTGKKNPMFGKTYYEIWVQKFGKDKADALQKDKNEKTSKQVSGSGNPMYGKPSPNGSGNGWSGWYKGWFFRSLRELAYIIEVAECSDVVWKSAESIKIPYISWKGEKRTYSPDFLINGNKLVEVKPYKLKSSLTVRLKQKAAEDFCKKLDWTYEIIDPPKLGNDKIKLLYEEKQIKFTKRYEIKYQKYYT